jgi:ATP-binding cassette, subfamily B, bacterial PglK
MSIREALVTILRTLGGKGRRAPLILFLLTLAGAAAEYWLLLSLLSVLQRWLAGGALETAPALAFAGAVLATGAFRLAILAGTQRLVFTTGHRLLMAAQRRIMGRPWPTHAAARGSAGLMTIEQVDAFLYGLLLPLVQAGVAFLLGTAIVLALVEVDAAVALAGAGLLLLLFALVTALLRPAVRRAGQIFSSKAEARISAIQRQTGAMRELILGGRRGLALEQLRAIDHDLASARISYGVASGAPRLLVETIGLLALAAAAWWLTGQKGGLGLAIPVLAALALGAQRLLPLAQTINQAVISLTANRPFLADLAALLAEPDFVEPAQVAPLPFTEAIELRGLSFAYPGREQPAVCDIDLRIRAGERVALVGPNGSGKSTLADLLMGLLSPGSGEIRVDGVELGEDKLRAWQRNITHVPQAPFLADASIAENIAFLDEPDAERLQQVAKLVGLDRFVAGLPDGFEARVGERGMLLSGGQRQRLALARALYSPAALLVLDEATTALDADSEAMIRQALDALQRAGTTIVIIAHQQAMLEGCDRIVRLEGGRIAEVQAAAAVP